jgi:LPXTG-motif cell wall-anchored protein
VAVLTLYEWMWFTLAGFVLMILAGVTSYKKAANRLQ